MWLESLSWNGQLAHLTRTPLKTFGESWYEKFIAAISNRKKLRILNLPFLKHERRSQMKFVFNSSIVCPNESLSSFQTMEVLPIIRTKKKLTFISQLCFLLLFLFSGQGAAIILHNQKNKLFLIT